MRTNPDLSIVVPFFNEHESLPELYDWIKQVVSKQNLSYEIVFIDDGSTDQSWKVVERLLDTQPFIKAVRFRRNHGKSAALYEGFKAATGNVVITMDADLQDSPDEIPSLYKMIKSEGYDLVSGWKKKRYDPLGKTIPSKFFNYTARKVSGIYLHDFNCGLKAYRGKVIKNIEIYGEMHRYIPMIAKEAGFAKIGEKVVEHHARKYGESKFGVERMIKGFLDLLSLKFTTKFGKKPMHLFGALGTGMFLIGGISTIYLIADKLIKQFSGMNVRQVTDQPAFFLALLFVILGVQLFLAGFLGELISRNSERRNDYFVDEVRESYPENANNRNKTRRRPPQRPNRPQEKTVDNQTKSEGQKVNNQTKSENPKGNNQKAETKTAQAGEEKGKKPERNNNRRNQNRPQSKRPAGADKTANSEKDNTSNQNTKA